MANITFLNDSINANSPITETVERKGLGHPDTLCDRISERMSVLYSQFCLAHFGRVAHHWFDKVMLIGGEADIGFGQGQLLTPYEAILAGKAATHVDGIEIPLLSLFRQAAEDVLTTTLRNFNAETDLIVTSKVRSGRGPGQPSSRYRPAGVQQLDQPGDNRLVSNDCNVCSGYYPLSLLEEIVLNVDEYLLHGEGGAHFNFLGSDIKTVGWRRGQCYSLVVNIPFLANAVCSQEDYLHKCEDLEDHLAGWIVSRWDQEVELLVNPERRWSRAYLTVTGTVADTGDVGVTGRGNRMNGLITPAREMSIEAVAGKNPLDHTGKLYNAMAGRVAQSIHELTGYACRVGISTVKGTPLDAPEDVTIVLDCPLERLEAYRHQLQTLVDEHLASVHVISADFISGDVIRVC